jgi:hypothetical protein
VSRNRDKGRLPPFVPLLISTLDAPAWKAMSYGARILYVALKRRVPRERNRAYLSYRDAAKEIGASKTRVAHWFRELQHYGFVVLLITRTPWRRWQGQGTTLAADRAWRNANNKRRWTA